MATMNNPLPGGLHLAATNLLPEAQAAALPSHWLQVIDEMGSEVGQTLSDALERVNQLTSTGRIDRNGLQQLTEEIGRARRLGMVGQQLSRIASGSVNQSAEEVNLTQTLRELLQQHGPAANAAGIELRPAMQPASVLADASLLHALLQAMLDWALPHAQSHIECRLELLPWPPNACLRCHFPLRRPGPPNGLAWRLVEQIAWALELRIERIDSPGSCTLLLEFTHTLQAAAPDVSVSATDPDPLSSGFGPSLDSKPLAGSHLLVLAGRRDLRSDIREAVRHMGLVLDFVSSVEEAERFCRETLPHGIICESVLAGQRFARLRELLAAEQPDFVCIEIAEEGDHCQLSTDSAQRQAQIGRHGVLNYLPSALIFELTRNS
ncbi:hypothetical protein [Ideonella sp.]|uniref:hypothetical protein n=2 Tax=Ideonella sp. TaxID=1929293 RepID=UPI00351AC5DD